ncbi:threonine/serine exporter family protein, partial [Streptococcus anginosus]|nr:threonine/serine exporter family protein [Streptococcus anginosus]
MLRLGQMFLASGASAYRVKNSMTTLAKAVGIAEHHAQVTYTEIIATAYANGTFRTGLAEQRQMGVNADRIDRLNNYVASIKGKAVLVEDAEKALD